MYHFYPLKKVCTPIYCGGLRIENLSIYRHSPRLTFELTGRAKELEDDDCVARGPVQ